MIEEILGVHRALREWTRQQTDFRLRVRGHTVQRNLIEILKRPDDVALRELTARNVAELAEAAAFRKVLGLALAQLAKCE